MPSPPQAQPAFIIRSPRADEADGVVALLNACDIADYGAPNTSVEDVTSDWDLPDFDIASDAWVAEDAAGQLVGYAYAGDQTYNGEIQGDLFVHPSCDEPAVARRLLDLVEQRAAELVAEHSYTGRRVLALYCSATNRAKAALLAHDGFVVVRRLLRMQIDLSQGLTRSEPPAGIEIRPFRAGVDDQTMYKGVDEAFADHFQRRDESFEQWRQRLLDHPDFRPELWQIAWDGEQMAGGLIAYDFGDLGWVQALGVRRPWRHRGLGGALLARAFELLAARQQTRVGLGVDAEGETGALHLYERAGMRITQEHDLFERPI
jgi:mycothiol synthase